MNMHRFWKIYKYGSIDSTYFCKPNTVEDDILIHKAETENHQKYVRALMLLDSPSMEDRYTEYATILYNITQNS